MMIHPDLFLSFFWIGLFTFGGGYAMIPMISEVVVGKGWLSTGTLVDLIAISESTPGPFAVNISTFVGMSQAGWLGAVCATLGVVLPSFLVILIIARFFLTFAENRFVRGALSGLRPAAVGLIAAAMYAIARAALLVDAAPEPSAPAVDWKAVAIAAIVLGLTRLKPLRKLHPVFLILISAALGIAFYGWN